MFRNRTNLNTNIKKPGLHISLSFESSDHVTSAVMSAAANRYMEKAGLGQHPYAVYRHSDTMNAHCHLVSTTIRSDGTNAEIKDLLLWRSRAIVKETANELGLRMFAKTGPDQQAAFEVSNAQKVVYGEMYTQRALSDVLNTVVPHFRYGSLDELNVLLKEYNVYANRGNVESRLYERRGLQFHVLTDDGKLIGSPMPARSFFLKPTLNNIEARFAENLRVRASEAERVRSSVDWVVASASDLVEVRSGLEKDGIAMVEGARSEPGRIYFIDFRYKNIFPAEELGSSYTLSSLRERLVERPDIDQEQSLEQRIRLRIW